MLMEKCVIRSFSESGASLAKTTPVLLPGELVDEQDEQHPELYAVPITPPNLSISGKDIGLKPMSLEDFRKKIKSFQNSERWNEFKTDEGVIENERADILADRELSEEFADILKRVLMRLEEVENIDASASFGCLKSTMSIYLLQETKPGRSANWIVRNFEQIDGDILRSGHGDPNIIYHFACLEDEDVGAIKRAEFPWPLNDDFFEVAQNPVDWKYQVYVKCCNEYKNFKKYITDKPQHIEMLNNRFKFNEFNICTQKIG